MALDVLLKGQAHQKLVESIHLYNVGNSPIVVGAKMGIGQTILDACREVAGEETQTLLPVCGGVFEAREEWTK